MTDTHTMGEFGSAAFVADRAFIYRLVFEEGVNGPSPSPYIDEQCQILEANLAHYSKKAQDMCKGKLSDLTRLAGKVKYARAHIELAKCYGKQLGIMTEHREFRNFALMYLSLAKAECEAIEYFEVR